jgi:hypothetical protein
MAGRHGKGRNGETGIRGQKLEDREQEAAASLIGSKLYVQVSKFLD